MLDRDYQEMAANGICQAAQQASIATHQCAADVAREQMRPCVLFRPALSIDGDQWCALYGGNLQDGVAGFGDTPGEAMSDFDRQWTTCHARKADSKGGEA
jgi:hypothetical protein